MTSRNQLTGLVAAKAPARCALGPAAPRRGPRAARPPARAGPGRRRTAARSTTIIDRCARLPLALAIVAARAAAAPRLPAGRAGRRAARGRDAGWTRSTGDDPATDVRAVFSWSYRAAHAPAAARLFRLLGLHPGPDIAAPAAASLAGLPSGAARPLLAELTRAHLLTEHVPGRYAFHDLLRAYAAELAARPTPTTERRRRPAPAARPLPAHRPRRRPAAAPAPRADHPDRRRSPASPPERLADREQALAWFTAEHRRAARRRRRTPPRPASTPTPGSWPGRCATFLDRRGHWHDQAVTPQTRARGRRRAAGRPGGQAHAHRGLGLRLHPAGPARRRPRPPAAAPSTCSARSATTRPGPHPPQPRPGVRAAGPLPARRSTTPGGPWTCSGRPATAAGQANALNAVGW